MPSRAVRGVLPHLYNLLQGAGRTRPIASSFSRGLVRPAVSEGQVDETPTVVTRTPAAKLQALREQLGQDQRTLNDFIGVEPKDEVKKYSRCTDNNICSFDKF
jgi:hypothetical protein